MEKRQKRARGAKGPPKPLPPLYFTLKRALNAKAVAEGRDYDLKDLANDAGYDYSYLNKVMKGERDPSRKVLAALGRVLRPYTSEEELLINEEYLPPDPLGRDDEWRAILLALWRQRRASPEHIGKVRRVEFVVESPEDVAGSGSEPGSAEQQAPCEAGAT